ncbi:hypothetical protein PTKIN_Ptkin05aG0101700 [Pterospermum kingtungense]
MIRTPSSKTLGVPARFQNRSALQIASAVFNGCLGLVYLCFCIWILEEKLRKTHCFASELVVARTFPGLHMVIGGFNCESWGDQLPRTSLHLLSVLALIFAVIVCAFSILAAILNQIVTIKIVLDALSLPGAILLLLCAYKEYKYEDGDQNNNRSGLYDPLINAEANGSTKADYTAQVTPFSTVGCFSKFSFWWLNPLMEKAIYKKKLRLSNATRLMHSSCQMTDYATVDAYRIGEFPFWFHQTWTTSLQLCISLVILFRAIGLATIAALVVIILAVLCNTPLA